jgi:hypothetical protein
MYRRRAYWRPKAERGPLSLWADISFCDCLIVICKIIIANLLKIHDELTSKCSFETNQISTFTMPFAGFYNPWYSAGQVCRLWRAIFRSSHMICNRYIDDSSRYWVRPDYFDTNNVLGPRMYSKVLWNAKNIAVYYSVKEQSYFIYVYAPSTISGHKLGYLELRLTYDLETHKIRRFINLIDHAYFYQSFLFTSAHASDLEQFINIIAAKSELFDIVANISVSNTLTGEIQSLKFESQVIDLINKVHSMYEVRAK